MPWFKKPEEGDTPAAASPAAARPEPREPRDIRSDARSPAPRAADVAPAPAAAATATAPAAAGATGSHKALEPRPMEVRSSERLADAPPLRASVLGPTLRFRGELSAQEDLIVQGSVEGSITHTQSLTIGADGTMKGDIRARVIVVDGMVEGNLYATESINVRATAKVKGNVFAPRVGISDGAIFQGQVEMQPSGAAVQEHSARLRQAALSSAQSLEAPAVDQMLSAAH